MSLDADTVRPYAQAHGQAVVDGDIERVMADIAPELAPHMGPVATALPRPTTSADVVSAEPGDDGAVVVQIRYRGAEAEATIRSVWRQVGDRPLIVEAAAV